MLQWKNLENEIFENILLKSNKSKENSEDKSSEQQMVITFHASKCIDDFWRYFKQNDNERSPSSALDICADFIRLQLRKRI